MHEKTLIIIGGGTSGLAAGCYAQMNGYRTKIFEQHNSPGGLCTSWKRKGYTFDFCIHDLAGAGENSSLHHIWQELGALEGTTLIHFKEFWRVENMAGKPLRGFSDPSHLDLHLRAHSPQDHQVISRYIRAIKHFSRFELFSIQDADVKTVLRMFPHIPTVLRWSLVNMRTFAQRFKDPFLRSAFPFLQYGWPHIPLSVNLNFVACTANGRFAWPSGGSLAFARNIARRYEALGGELHTNAKVDEILVDGDRAAGVRLTDGSIYEAERVISTADGKSTIFHMLDGRYTNRFIRNYYKNPPEGCEMNLVVSLGVRREMKDEPRAITLILDEPVYIGDRMRDRLDIEIAAYEPTFAPQGCTALKVMLTTNYAPWRSLYDDRQRYEDAKQQVAEDVIEILERRFPGIRRQVEVIDVATPLTIERYTGNFHGLQVWFPKRGILHMVLFGISRTLPGLKNFYMAGQWSGMTIGLHTTAISSRKLIRIICKEDGREFTVK